MCTPKKYLSACMFVLFMFACDRVTIDFFNLGDFRVMAVLADQPEVDASIQNDVVITPWISDLDAQGGIVQLSIEACLDPGIGLGATPDCDSSDIAYQTINYLDFDTTSLTGQYFSGAMTDFTVTIPANLIDVLSSEDQFNGIDYIVSMVFTAGDDEIKAIKRIRMSTNPNRNQNPKLAAILVNGSSTQTITDQSKLNFSIETGFEQESYQRYNAEGELEDLEESYLVTWFVNGGLLSLSRSELDQNNTFSLEQGINGEPFVFAVLRDNRGGVDILFKD